MHCCVLVVSVAIIAVSISLKVYADQTVGCRFAPAHRLPPTCFFREQLGMDCPSCGLTRSFVHFFHADLSASFTAHWSGWLLALGFLFELPYRVIAIRRLALPRERWLATWHSKSVLVLLALLAISWLAKLAFGA